jgi:hypothetical protein
MGVVDITPAMTPAELRGRGTGIIVCAFFAALWAEWARPLLTDSPAAYVWIASAIIAAVSGTLLFAGVSMIRRGRRLAKATGVADTAPRSMQSKFKWVLIAEIVAINIAAYALINHHMAQYLAPAIAIIVGLHFLPLARVFRAPHYFVTAVVMTMAGILAAAVMMTGNSAVSANGIADLVCAIALWGTGFITWRRVHTSLNIFAQESLS